MGKLGYKLSLTCFENKMQVGKCKLMFAANWPDNYVYAYKVLIFLLQVPQDSHTDTDQNSVISGINRQTSAKSTTKLSRTNFPNQFKINLHHCITCENELKRSMKCRMLTGGQQQTGLVLNEHWCELDHCQNQSNCFQIHLRDLRSRWISLSNRHHPSGWTVWAKNNPSLHLVKKWKS